MKYKILQLDKSRHGTKDVLFRGWAHVAPHFNLRLYKEVWAGEIESSERVERTLEYLFLAFNRSLPEGYRGHSLSVSDVVEFPEEGLRYYCDDSGWVRVG